MGFGLKATVKRIIIRHSECSWPSGLACRLDMCSAQLQLWSLWNNYLWWMLPSQSKYSAWPLAWHQLCIRAHMRQRLKNHWAINLWRTETSAGAQLLNQAYTCIETPNNPSPLEIRVLCHPSSEAPISAFKSMSLTDSIAYTTLPLHNTVSQICLHPLHNSQLSMECTGFATWRRSPI